LKVISSDLSLADSNSAEHPADVMLNSHQACSDRVKAIAAQKVQGQSPQHGQYLDIIAMGVAVCVLPKLGFQRPVPLVFNRPALPHQPE
jgi:hypothetical protein